MKNFVIQSILFAMFLLCSCASPQPVYRISPVSNDYWENGRGFNTVESKGVVMQSGNSDTRADGYLIISVKITNKTGKSLLVDPDGFSCIVTGDIESENIINKAYDPEERLITIEKKLAKENARYKNSKIADSAIDLMGAIADFGEPVSDEDEEESYSREQQAEDIHRSRMRNLNGWKEFWSNMVLRKTMLISGSTLSGFVVFRDFKGEKNFIFNYTMGDVSLESKFSKIRISLN